MDGQVHSYMTLVHILSINLEKQMCRPKDSHLPAQDQGAVCSIAELTWELRMGLVLPLLLKSADSAPRSDNRGLLASRTQTPTSHGSKLLAQEISTLPCCFCGVLSLFQVFHLAVPGFGDQGPRANVPHLAGEYCLNRHWTPLSLSPGIGE